MNTFLWNLILALAWAAVTGTFTLANLAFGFLLGALVTGLAEHRRRPGLYLRKISTVVRFVFFYLGELIQANLKMVVKVLSPRLDARPVFLAVPLEPQRPAETTLLANLLTMTPGTISIEVSPNGRILYVHAMFVDDIAALRETIKTGLERRVLEVMR
jgi:multicomponent Na+:H+ antiporter subunit E